MKRWTQRTWIKIIAVALSLSLIAAAVALVLSGTGVSWTGWAETVSRPFSRLAATVTGWAEQGAAYFQGVETLQAEKAALEKEVAQLQAAARAGELARQENARLRALLDWPETGQDLTLTPAWVIARTPDNWQGEVTLDQGKAQGLQPGQCVVDHRRALVGRVKEVGDTWATVTLVTDGAFQLAGQASASGVLGTLQGDLALLPQGEVAFASLTEADPVSPGEAVVTFAAGETYPSGLLVGTVDRVESDPGGLTRSAILTPAADLASLAQVCVVTAGEEVR